MERYIALLRKYKIFIVLVVTNLLLIIFLPEIGKKSLLISKENFFEMLAVIPPVFILLGLLDVWMKKETMMKFMGESSGIIGVLIAFLLGSIAAGPLYAAFPVAGVLLKKGSKISNVLIFIGAWSTMKIPLLMFETTALGANFSMLRLGFSIVGILIIAITIDRTLNENDKKMIYKLEKNQKDSLN